MKKENEENDPCISLLGEQAKESWEHAAWKSNHVLQAVHKPIAELSVSDEFVAVFAAANCQPA